MHSALASDVTTTIVDGRTLMRDRRLLTLDVPSAVAELGAELPALIDRSHALASDVTTTIAGGRTLMRDRRL